MVQNNVKETTKILKSWNEKEDPTYAKYFKDSNPEILWHKILAKYASDKEELGRLTKSLIMACESIKKMSHSDNLTSAAFQLGPTEEFLQGLEEKRDSRNANIAFIDQCFDEIKSKLNK